jgi:hypothetical protein
MSKKSKTAKGDGAIKSINLNRGQYSEITLVDKICTAAQKRSYYKKEKFPNSKQREMFLERLSCYCDFEYDPNTKKYKIKEVFKYPRTAAEIKIHKDIYQYLAPLILDTIINSKSRQAIFSVYELTKDTNMVNQNYAPMKFAQNEVSYGLQIPRKTISEYFDKADSYIHHRIKQCIQYLSETGCIFFNETRIIKKVVFTDVQVNLNGYKSKGKSEIRKATDDELDLYAKLLEIADNEVGIKSNQDRWYGKKARAFKDTLSRLLRDHNIAYVTKGFEIFRVHLDRCEEIMQTFSDTPLDQYRKEVGTLLKAISDCNAEGRIKDGKCIDFDEDYLENFKNLSEISLLYGAKNITEQIPSLKRSYDERMKNQSELMECQYMEV